MSQTLNLLNNAVKPEDASEVLSDKNFALAIFLSLPMNETIIKALENQQLKGVKAECRLRDNLSHIDLLISKMDLSGVSGLHAIELPLDTLTNFEKVLKKQGYIKTIKETSITMEVIIP